MLLNFKELKAKYNMNISGIIHIGAHYGQEVSDYIENGVSNIILFEPVKNTFKILCQRMENLNADIKLHNIALGSSVKKTMMYISDNEGQSSSILQPVLHLSHHPDVYFPDTEEVNVDILDNYDCNNHNCICMDVQGYELEVLKGASKTLKNINYVYCEVNRDEVYENNAYIENIDEFLNYYNFKRVETCWDGGIWGDALYVKEKKKFKLVSKYDAFLSNLKLDLNSSPVIIDVGCNIDNNLNDYTELFFSIYPNSKSIGIEPLFWNDYEKKWGNDARVTIIKKALSNSIDKKTLYTPSVFSNYDHALSSFFNRSIFSLGQKVEENEVDCITLDILFSDLNLNIIDYLKIDTEGSELTILQGCVELLTHDKIRYIQLEYGETYTDAGYTELDVINFLRNYDYKLIFKTENITDIGICGEIIFGKNTTYIN